MSQYTICTLYFCPSLLILYTVFVFQQYLSTIDQISKEFLCRLSSRLIDYGEPVKHISTIKQLNKHVFSYYSTHTPSD